MAVAKAGLMKSLGVWLGSFILAATILFFYFHVPPLILLVAGIGTFILTLVRCIVSARSGSPR